MAQKEIRIAYLGGGSRGWAHTLMHDLAAKRWMSTHWGGYPMFNWPSIRRGLDKVRRNEEPAGRMLWLDPGQQAVVATGM
jgi:hypothetical protein